MTLNQITVAIPVFNGQDYISLAINSVLLQTHKDFELLIIDNCSTDETVKIIQNFDDPRIRLVINDSNIGMVANWNLAVQLAKGQFIKILSHDDLIDTNCLIDQLRAFIQNEDKNIGIVTAKKRIINTEGTNIMPGFGLNGETRFIDGRVAIRKSIRAGRNIIGEPSVVLLRTELLRSCGNFENPEFTPDIKMWFKILEKSNLIYINKTMASYRVSAKSSSTAMSKTQGSQFVSLIRESQKNKEISLGRFSLRVGIIRSHLNSRLRRLVTYLASLRR
jgi:glycosyltransferase involved in cell wall biosynthesis